MNIKQIIQTIRNFFIRPQQVVVAPSYLQAEEYWNNKWTKSDIIYKAREDAINFDVRNFITIPDAVLKNILTNYRLIGKSHDETVWLIMGFVQDTITYESDSKQFGFTEQWDFPAEVISRKKADCEGMSQLIVSLIENAGIPNYKIKIACGYVNDKKGKQLGGHSYPIYLRESDNQWIDLDPCFYANKKSMNKRTPVKENKVYGEIWFTFNSKYSWSQHNLEIGDDLITPKKV